MNIQQDLFDTILNKMHKANYYQSLMNYWFEQRDYFMVAVYHTKKHRLETNSVHSRETFVLGNNNEK